MCCRGAATRRRGEKRPKLCLLFVGPKDGSHKNEFSRKIPAGRNKSLKTLLSVCLFLSTLFWWQQAVGILYLWPTWIMDDFVCAAALPRMLLQQNLIGAALHLLHLHTRPLSTRTLRDPLPHIQQQQQQQPLSRETQEELQQGANFLRNGTSRPYIFEILLLRSLCRTLWHVNERSVLKYIDTEIQSVSDHFYRDIVIWQRATYNMDYSSLWRICYTN